MHWPRQLVYFSTSQDRVHRLAVNSSTTPRRRPLSGRRRRARAGNETSQLVAGAELLYQGGGGGGGGGGHGGLQVSVDWLYDRLYIADENTVRRSTHPPTATQH